MASSAPEGVAGAVLGCLDNSRYAPSVCDHVAWLTAGLSARVALLHVEETAAGPAPEHGGSDVLKWGAERLIAEGATRVERIARTGRFLDHALELAGTAAVTVLGKRGESSEGSMDRLGSSVNEMLYQTQRPVCLVSQIFLPISRALVLIDARPEHRRAVEFVARNAALRALHLDLALIDDGMAEPHRKLEWAREAVGGRGARVFPLRGQDPHETAMRYFEGHASDLLIISREVLLGYPGFDAAHLDPGHLWSRRAPVLVC